MEFFELSNPWLWISLAAIFVIFEFAVLGSFYPLMLAIGLLVSGLTAFYVENQYILLGIFIVVTVLSTILIRPLLVKTIKVDHDVRPSAMDAIIGTVVTVTKPISKTSRGEINLKGEIWGALASEECEIAAGEEVIIVRVDGITVIVQPKGGVI